MDTHEQTITITYLPEDMSPTRLAHEGEGLALNANGPEMNPPPEVWIRAGIVANQILRWPTDGKLSVNLLVALIAATMDPDGDSSEARDNLISGHTSYHDAWERGEDPPTAKA